MASRLQACTKTMDCGICANVDEKNLQAREKENLLQSQTRRQDFANQHAEKELEVQEKEKHFSDHNAERDPEAQIQDYCLPALITDKGEAKEEKHLPDHNGEKDQDAQIHDHSLLAGIGDKWKANQGSASTLATDDDSSLKDNILSPNAKSSGTIDPKDRLHPASSTAVLPYSLFMTASRGCDVRPKERFRPSSSNADTRPNSSQSHVALDNTVQNCSGQMSDLLCAPDRGQSWPNRSRSTSKTKPNTPMTELKASPDFNDHECEVLQEGEEGVSNNWLTCKKHPGHKQFIPVNEFALQHLPEAYRNRAVLKGIKSVANVAVRLTVKYNSKARPDNDTLAKVRGTRFPHSGSGFVYTHFFSEDIQNIKVPENLTNDVSEDKGLQDHLSARYGEKTPNERLKYHLEKSTKSHRRDRKKNKKLGHAMKPAPKVSAGKKTKSHRRDRKKPKKLGHAMKPASKVSAGKKGIYESLGDILDPLDDIWYDSDDDVYDALNFFGPKTRDSVRGLISFINEFDDERNKFWFLKHALRFGNNYSLESKLSAKECERNYQLLNKFRKLSKFVEKASSSVERVLPDDQSHDDSDEWEDIDSDIDEDIEEDELDNGSSDYDYSDDDYSSDDSDDVFDTDVDFIEELNDSDLEELEREIINDFVETFGIVHPCCCPDCKTSKSPKPKGYYFNVLTARHVVFDKDEAMKTEVDLFYDDDSGKGKATLFGVDVHIYSDAGDLAVVMCATHDRKLMLKLAHLVKFMTLYISVLKSKSDTPLAFICSHPHGNFKHITVGEWVQRDIYQRKDGRPPVWTSYLYNTPTCPGSSGAPVVILGHREGTLLLDSMIHPHHGHHEEDINKSTRLVSFYEDNEYIFGEIGPKARKRELKDQKKLKDQIRKKVYKIVGRLDKLLQ